MSQPILATKFFVPHPRKDRVVRTALIQQLNAQMDRKLTLISAPAGFGKTSLLSEWIHAYPRPVAWISLDENESDPVHFMRYLVTSLQTIHADLGASILAILDAPQLPPMTTLLTTLINELMAFSQEFMLVLDDYHLVDVPGIQEIISFLLDHQPPPMHLVITTRADPTLPLGRLRSMNELSEFRAAELSFSREETESFFNQALTLNLSPGDIQALDDRTEGWVAGLQLAALSLQGRDDVSAYIRSFQGTDRHIVDYLAEEVLNLQSEHIKRFLLQTSILNRLSGPLCDAVIGGSDSEKVLNTLEQEGLFLVPMDRQRHWYRYLHLFGDLLKHRLHKDEELASTVDDLHHRASQWYEEAGFTLDALQHAFEGQDYDRAERLIHNDGAPLYLQGEASVIIQYLDALPGNLGQTRPSLTVTYAWAMMFAGRNRDLESILQSAEANIHSHQDTSPFHDLLGQIASMRGLMGITSHDPPAIIQHSQQALKLLDPENTSVRIATNFGLGYAYQLMGDLGAARASHEQVITSGVAHKNTIYSVGAAISLGQVAELENDLEQAAKHFRHALELAGDTPQLMAGEAHLGLARIHYAWNDLQQSQTHADKCLEFVLQIETGDTFCNHGLLMARLYLARGQTRLALASVEKARDYARAQGFEHIFPALAQTRILIFLAQGDLDAAYDLAETETDPLGLARVYLAGEDYANAEAQLAELHHGMESAGAIRDLLDVLVLEVLAAHGSGKPDQTAQRLSAALELSEASGSTRGFLDAGADFQKLLEEALQGSTHLNRNYARHLLNLFQLEGQVTATQGLADPLSQREMEVLRHIAAGLSNQKIAATLFVSMSTVKTHLRNIYTKLEVHSRTAAVARAQSLELL